MICLRGGVIFTGNGQNLVESSKFDISFDMFGFGIVVILT